MPLTVYKEQLDGTGYELSFTGSRLTLARKVSNLTSYTGYDRHLRAYFDSPTGFMQLGDPFPYPLPSQFSALILRTVQIEVLNADQGNYIYTFSAPDDPAVDLQPSDGVVPPTYELDYAVESVRTNYDVNGNLLWEYYSAPLVAGQPLPVQQKRLMEVETDESLQVFRYRRRETNPAGGNPAVFHNKVNSNQFTFAGEIHPPRTWLCRSIGIGAVFGIFGTAYDVTYEFMRRNQLVVFDTSPAVDIGWNLTTKFIDADGETPTDVVLGNGITLRQMKREVDFSDLKLWL